MGMSFDVFRKKLVASCGDCELLKIKDIAYSLGVHYNTVLAWKRKSDFPKPCGKVGGSKLWAADDVARWIVDNKDL